MRGNFLHNQVLLGPLEEVLRQQGLEVHREYHIGPGRKAGYADLVAWGRGFRLVVEAELTPDRIGRDLDKARQLQATHLLIVVPDRQKKLKIITKFPRLETYRDTETFIIWVAPPGIMVKRVMQLMSLKDPLECPSDLKSKNPK